MEAHRSPPSTTRAGPPSCAACEAHAVVAKHVISELLARVDELENQVSESEAAHKASQLRARAMRSEAEAEYDRRAKRRALGRADGMARAYVRDLLAAADESARVTLPAIEKRVFTAHVTT